MIYINAAYTPSQSPTSTALCYCKPAGDKNYTALTPTTTALAFIHKPARAIKYSYAVKIADAKGKTSTKYFTVNVKK